MSLLIGAICAVYLGLLVAPILEPVIGKLVPNGDSDGFSSFVVGIGDMFNSGQIIDIFRAGRTDARRTDGNAQPLPPEPAAPRRPGLAVSEENWSRRSGRSPFRACRGHSGLWPAPIGWSGFSLSA
jgi:hypothetical protein